MSAQPPPEPPEPAAGPGNGHIGAVPKWHEYAATIVILALLIGGALWAYLSGPTLAVQSSDPAQDVPSSACTVKAASPHPAKVSDASGATATLNIFIGRGGDHVQRQSSPLAVQDGTLPPGIPLCTASSDLVNAAGQILPAYQVATWAQVDNDGTHVTVDVVVAPRYTSVSAFGGYSGTVSLDDPRAVGANVPVSVHVEYYDVSDPVAWALLAAYGGFIWAWFIHRHLANGIAPQPFWSSLILRVAVLLAAAIPVVNVQVLTNPDWAGSLSQYITLATLAGAAAIAAAPTLRVIASIPPRLARSAPPGHG